MQNFQGIALKWIESNDDIFKSALVYLRHQMVKAQYENKKMQIK